MDAAQIRVEDELNGTPIEEMLFAIINCREVQVQFPRPYNRLICNSMGTSITRAPQGHLDEMIAHRPAPPQINDDWNSRIIQSMRSQFQQIQDASNLRFQEITQHYAQVNQDLLARSRQQDAVRAAGTAAAMRNDASAQAAIDN